MLRFLGKFILLLLLLDGIQGFSQLPLVTVRFANPEFDPATFTYCLDVEFQCDTPNQQLYGMSVRFYYDEDVLEFEAFGDFAEGYAAVNPNPPYVSTLSTSYGPMLFGFEGAPEYINGAIQKVSYSSVYLSTTDWTKIFNICFHVDDSTALNGDFCPSVVWDLEEDPINGGFIGGGDGVVVTIVGDPPDPSAPADRAVIQYNWNYDGIPGFPFGYPESNICVSNRVAPTTKIQSTFANGNGFVTFPFKVWNFVDISSFSLTVDYDPTVLEYCCSVPDDEIAESFDTTLIYPGRIQLTSDGFNTSLPDGTTLFHATFQYLGGSTSILWCDDGSSCQYLDAATGLPLPDEPTSVYYYDGNVASGQHAWTGNVSSDWNDPGNWQDSIIPNAFDHVNITSSTSPLYWPAYTGDFTMGEQCKYLTLFGAAELTVAGDMIINPGQVLNISDNAEIIVAGDWVNSGTFNPGAGTVTFNGTEDGWISDGPPPASYISGFEYSSFTQGMTAISGGTPGPTGDDAHSDVSIGFTFNYLGVDYTEVRINTNGWLSLNLSGDDNTSHENASLFNASSPTTAIAPWWDNLLADASAVISYLTEGTAPNRIFTVEWNNILSFNTDATARLNFQVKLYESTNIIEFHYGGLTAGTHHPDEGASMGINDSQGGPGNFMEAVNGTTHMMVSCIKSDPNWPANNVRFTPPVTNPMETFYQVTVTKTPGKLRLDRDVTVTGVQ